MSLTPLLLISPVLLALAALSPGARGELSVKHSAEVVYLVDDDLSIRESITDLLEQEGVSVVSFESAPAFLKHRRVDSAACLLLDLQLPEMSGLQLQEQLVRTSSLPIVFISGCGDIPSSVRDEGRRTSSSSPSLSIPTR